MSTSPLLESPLVYLNLLLTLSIFGAKCDSSSITVEFINTLPSEFLISCNKSGLWKTPLSKDCLSFLVQDAAIKSFRFVVYLPHHS
jgi:hypothetical protein